MILIFQGVKLCNKLSIAKFCSVNRNFGNKLFTKLRVELHTSKSINPPYHDINLLVCRKL